MRYLILIIILVAVTHPVWSDTPQDLFTAANRLYESGEYDQAMEKYKRVEKELQHWKLFYNMGNCWYKTGNIVQAKIYYLRARRLKPLDASIEKNIQLINSKFKDKFSGDTPDFLQRVVLRLESVISLNLLSVVFLVVLLFLNISIFLLLSGRRRRFIWYAALLFLCLTLAAGIYHVYRADKDARRDLAVVITPDAQLHSGPGENHTILFKVNPGLDVRIIERSREWAQVMAPPQVAGWIRLDSLEVI